MTYRFRTRLTYHVFAPYMTTAFVLMLVLNRQFNWVNDSCRREINCRIAAWFDFATSWVDYYKRPVDGVRISIQFLRI